MNHSIVLLYKVEYRVEALVVFSTIEKPCDKCRILITSDSIAQHGSRHKY